MNLGLDFPSIPHFFDGDFKMTESQAIMKYVAKKYEPSLLGRSAQEVGHVEMLRGVLYDVHAQLGTHQKKGDRTASDKYCDTTG